MTTSIPGPPGIHGSSLLPRGLHEMIMALSPGKSRIPSGAIVLDHGHIERMHTYVTHGDGEIWLLFGQKGGFWILPVCRRRPSQGLHGGSAS